MTGETIIRASSLPAYQDCPRRWAAQTLRRELGKIGFPMRYTLPSIGAGVGTATHSGVGYFLEQRMATGYVVNETEVEDFALESLAEESAGEMIWDEVTPSRNDAEKQVLRMVKAYRLTIGATIMPLAVERRLSASVGRGFLLTGQSDVQTLEPGRIRDLKTGKKHRTHYPQLGAYSLLARTVHPDSSLPVPVKELCVDFVARAAMNKPQPMPVTEFYDQATAEHSARTAMDRIQADVADFRRRVEDGDAPPEHAFLANPGSMLCSPKWCPAHGTKFCREHKQT